MGKSHESRQKQTRNTKEEPPCRQSGLDKMESGLLALLPKHESARTKERAAKVYSLISCQV